MQAPESGRARRQPPLVGASVLLHAAAAAAVIARPRTWPWALAAVVADHLLLVAAGLWPRSQLLGENWTHLPASATGRVALTIDDGPDPEVTPRTLELLARHGTHATFFCIGERVARHPQLARLITEQGHAIGNHSHRHRHNFSLLGPRALAREVRHAQQAITEATGTTPRFFRAPAGLRNVFLEPVLARENLRLVSWTRRGFDTVNRDPARVLARLTRGLRARDILLLHDGHAARTAAGDAVILQILPPLLQAFAQTQLEPVTLTAALAPARVVPVSGGAGA